MAKKNPVLYTQLRTMLDSLEVGTLRYFLDGTGKSQPDKFKELQEMLQPVIDEVWGWGEQINIDCPDGYYDCNGCCVPYRCPDVSMSKAKPKPARAGAKRKR